MIYTLEYSVHYWTCGRCLEFYHG